MHIDLRGRLLMDQSPHIVCCATQDRQHGQNDPQQASVWPESDGRTKCPSGPRRVGVPDVGGDSAVLGGMCHVLGKAALSPEGCPKCAENDDFPHFAHVGGPVGRNKQYEETGPNIDDLWGL